MYGKSAGNFSLCTNVLALSPLQIREARRQRTGQEPADGISVKVRTPAGEVLTRKFAKGACFQVGGFSFYELHRSPFSISSMRTVDKSKYCTTSEALTIVPEKWFEEINNQIGCLSIATGGVRLVGVRRNSPAVLHNQ